MCAKEKNDPFEENPFENLPSDDAHPSKRGERSPPGSPHPRKTVPGPTVVYGEGRLGRSTLALVSGAGIFAVVVIMYFLLATYWSWTNLIVVLLAVFFSMMIPLFYLLDDLTIRPTFMNERISRFVSGMFLGALALLTLAVLNSGYDQLFLVPLFALMILTSMSAAVFLHTMLWEG